MEMDISTLSEFGAWGVLAFVLIMVMRYMLTKQDEAFRDIENALNIHTMSIVFLQKQILMHDMTVSGINPGAGSTDVERDSKAFQKYQELQVSLDRIVGMIERGERSPQFTRRDWKGGTP